MYFRLTSRCNMSCDHCAFSASKRGKDMSREVFDAGLRLQSKYDDYMTLGGGEPTLHPQFWPFFGEAVALESEFPVAIVTNGSNKTISIALAKMAQSGFIHAALSQDYWHDRIDYEVVDAFTKKRYGQAYGSHDHDNREIRDVSNGVVDIGRAKKNQLGASKHCVCDSIMIEPDGRLLACGCRKKSYGTVFRPEIPDDYWQRDDRCSRAA